MNKEINSIIKENPDLDIVVMVSTQELTDDYGSLLMEKLKIEVTDIYNSPTNEYIYFDKSDIVDILRDFLCEEEEYKDMSDEEYDKMCEEKANDYFYKRAIVIWAEN